MSRTVKLNDFFFSSTLSCVDRSWLFVCHALRQNKFGASLTMFILRYLVLICHGGLFTIYTTSHQAWSKATFNGVSMPTGSLFNSLFGLRRNLSDPGHLTCSPMSHTYAGSCALSSFGRAVNASAEVSNRGRRRSQQGSGCKLLWRSSKNRTNDTGHFDLFVSGSGCTPKQ